MHQRKTAIGVGMNHQAQCCLAITRDDVDHRCTVDQIDRGDDQPRADVDTVAPAAPRLEPHHARHPRIEHSGEQAWLDRRAVCPSGAGRHPGLRVLLATVAVVVAAGEVSGGAVWQPGGAPASASNTNQLLARTRTSPPRSPAEAAI
jgi:hypothetical protein